MKIFFEKRLLLEEFLKSILFNKEINYISEEVQNARSKVCKSAFDKHRFISISHTISNVDLLGNRSLEIEDTLKFCYDSKEVIMTSSIKDSLDLEVIAKIIKLNKNDILLNITNINTRLLGILLASIKRNYNPISKKRILVAYTEAKRYSKKEATDYFSPNSIVNNSSGKSNLLSPYALYEDFLGLSPIPYLESTGNPASSLEDWIIFLGYEGGRPNYIMSMASKKDRQIAVFTVPPVQPGWNNVVLSENLKFLEAIKEKTFETRFVSAISPFASYNFLSKYQYDNKANHLFISPFSTRASTLGVLLFALNNPTSEIAFDNPRNHVGNHKGTENSFGKTYIYDITEIISEPIKEEQF